MKRVLILEDDEEQRNIILDLLEENIKEEIKVYTTDRAEEAYRYLLHTNIHLFLIDTILDTGINGDVSGLYFAQAVRQIPQYYFTPMIFISSLEDPKLFSYKQLHCYAFVEKPYDKREFVQLIRGALKFPENNVRKRNLFLRIDGIIYSVKIDDILYLEGERRKLSIYTKKEKIIVKNKTLSGIMNELNSENFIRCSRFSIVNKRYVKYIDYVNQYIKLYGTDEVVEIGVSMKKRIRSQLEE